MVVKFNPETGAITWVRGLQGDVCDFPITQEQFDAGVTLERRRKGRHPAAIRLADDTIVEEINYPPRPS